MAQLVAEADGCDYINSRLGFDAFPIYSILCSRNSFEFSCFDSRTNPPTFSHCRHSSGPLGRYALLLGELSGQGIADFIRSLRPIFGNLRNGSLHSPLRLYNRNSCTSHQRLCSGRVQMTGERQFVFPSKRCSTQSRRLPKRLLVTISRRSRADKVAKDASERLAASVAAVPPIYKWPEYIMKGWDEDRVNAA